MSHKLEVRTGGPIGGQELYAKCECGRFKAMLGFDGSVAGKQYVEEMLNSWYLIHRASH